MVKMNILQAISFQGRLILASSFDFLIFKLLSYKVYHDDLRNILIFDYYPT